MRVLRRIPKISRLIHLGMRVRRRIPKVSRLMHRGHSDFVDSVHWFGFRDFQTPSLDDLSDLNLIPLQTNSGIKSVARNQKPLLLVTWIDLSWLCSDTLIPTVLTI